MWIYTRTDLTNNTTSYKTDQDYIINTIDGFKIQLIDSKSDYDELKYLSGKDAIDFLQT